MGVSVGVDAWMGVGGECRVVGGLMGVSVGGGGWGMGIGWVSPT